MKRNNQQIGTLVVFGIIFFFIFGIGFLGTIFSLIGDIIYENSITNNFYVLSSYENRDFETILYEYADKKNINLNITYMGDLDIVDELNENSDQYDAVWISNSIWLYMLDNSYTTSESKSISISPVVMGIRKSKAEELGLINKEIYNKDILELISSKKIKYVMSSVTQTNTGATAYLGFLNALAGSPEVLTEDMLDNQTLIENMTNLFSGVERVSGDESYLEDMFINDSEFEAVIASESSLININQELASIGKEELYLLYPIDGVPINDSTFAFIDNDRNKKEKFLELEEYLLSENGQKELKKLGRRTWYGGVSTNVDKNVFNPSWGIDTTKYLITSKYPSKTVMTKAINLYIEELRKPTHVVFCLDYSGSMYGEGITELRNAMNYILDYESASLDQLQFSKKDKITVITFGSRVENIWSTNSGLETTELIRKINSENPTGSTALYDAIIEGFNILDQESNDYTKTIIAMTDGAVNVGRYSSVANRYVTLKEKVPIYSITFGNSNETQLNELATLTNAKVFDGRTNLLNAFKEVRGYN